MTFNKWLEQKDIDEQWFNPGYKDSVVYNICLNNRDLVALNNAVSEGRIPFDLQDLVADRLAEQFGVYCNEQCFVDEIDFWSVEYHADEIYDLDVDAFEKYGVPGAEGMEVYDFNDLRTAEFVQFDHVTNTVYLSSAINLAI